MATAAEERNKAVVLEAFDTLANRRNFAAAQRFWPPHLHSAHKARSRSSTPRFAGGLYGHETG